MNTDSNEQQGEALKSPGRLWIHAGANVETKACGCGNDVEYVRADLASRASIPAVEGELRQIPRVNALLVALRAIRDKSSDHESAKDIALRAIENFVDAAASSPAPAEPAQPQNEQVCKCGLEKDDPIHSYTTEWQQMHKFTPRDTTTPPDTPSDAAMRAAEEIADMVGFDVNVKNASGQTVAAIITSHLAATPVVAREVGIREECAKLLDQRVIEIGNYQTRPYRVARRELENAARTIRALNTSPSETALPDRFIELFRDTAIKCHIGFKHKGPWEECEWIECEERRKLIAATTSPSETAVGGEAFIRKVAALPCARVDGDECAYFEKGITNYCASCHARELLPAPVSPAVDDKGEN